MTAGYITPAARDYFFREMDAANVDLKAFTEQFYQQLTYSHLQPVLDTLVWLQRETEVWFELTNLIIPRENDDPDELRRMCGWIVEQLGEAVPVHFTAFHPDFRLRDRPNTPLETLLGAYEIARAEGIQFVYVGNVHDPAHDSTYCPHCGTLLIERNWHQLGMYRLVNNRCSKCDKVIAGRFDLEPGQWGRRRQVVRIADYAVAPERVEPTVGNGQDGQTIPATEADSMHTGSHPPLTDSQRRAVFGAACELITAGVMQRPASLTDPTLQGVADLPVMGAFVTLKRHGLLRACCGALGQTTSLSSALQQAAHRTATDDQRLAPISPTELPFLELDVSLLSQFQPVPGRGRERMDAVHIGQHGLTIRLAQHTGLLLPNVAVEHGWDGESFLRQICRKAGLPPHSWLDDAAELQTFETQILAGPIDPGLLADIPARSPRLLTDSDLSALNQHCRANVVALVQGATPNYYLPSCRDMNVQGMVLVLHVTGQAQHPQFARLSLRPGLPLQATLFQLCESAAQWIRAGQFAPGWESELDVEVAVLSDSAAHGTVATPDLRGATADRALVVAQNGRYAWRFDPQSTSEQLLEEAASEQLVYDPDTASILSFAVETSAAAIRMDLLPHPQRGPARRPCAVAGTFYPDQSQALEHMVDQITARPAADGKRAVPAVMVPHAGLRFSGHIAAQVFQRVVIPSRVIILAPKHTRHGAPWAVAPHEYWQIPGSEIASDVELSPAVGGRDLAVAAGRHSPSRRTCDRSPVAAVGAAGAANQSGWHHHRRGGSVGVSYVCSAAGRTAQR